MRTIWLFGSAPTQLMITEAMTSSWIMLRMSSTTLAIPSASGPNIAGLLRRQRGVLEIGSLFWNRTGERGRLQARPEERRADPDAGRAGGHRLGEVVRHAEGEAPLADPARDLGEPQVERRRDARRVALRQRRRD